MYRKAWKEDGAYSVLKVYLANPYVLVMISNDEELIKIILHGDMLSCNVSRRPELPETLPQGRMLLCR